MMATESRLIIVSAPSGAGKTSLSRRLILEHDDIAVAVSHTTRASRPGECAGRDYHFVSHAEFEQLIVENGFLEYARVFDEYYGTSKQAVQSILDAGRHVLLEIDWQGANSIRKLMPQAISIFILPPSKQALHTRLTQRGQDNMETINRRMRDALNQISHYREYDAVIVNDEFDQAYQELESIVYNLPYDAHIGPDALDQFVANLHEGNI